MEKNKCLRFLEVNNFIWIGDGETGSRKKLNPIRFMLYNNLTWTALLIKVARSLIWQAFCLGCWQIYISCICNGNITHGKGNLLRWKPMQNDLLRPKGQDQPSNCSSVMPCHALPMQQSHRGRSSPGGMQVHVLGQVSASHALLWQKHVIEISFRECMS